MKTGTYFVAGPKSLEEGAGVVVSASVDSVSASNEEKLVHVSGLTKTDEVLADEAFGISENAIQLVRDVEMYQWVEESSTQTEKKLGGSEERTTTYEYDKAWRSPSSTLRDSRALEGTRTLAPFPTIRVG